VSRDPCTVNRDPRIAHAHAHVNRGPISGDAKAPALASGSGSGSNAGHFVQANCAGTADVGDARVAGYRPAFASRVSIA
jgi:hypothetical protein